MRTLLLLLRSLHVAIYPDYSSQRNTHAVRHCAYKKQAIAQDTIAILHPLKQSSEGKVILQA